MPFLPITTGSLVAYLGRSLAACMQLVQGCRKHATGLSVASNCFRLADAGATLLIRLFGVGLGARLQTAAVACDALNTWASKKLATHAKQQATSPCPESRSGRVGNWLFFLFSSAAIPDLLRGRISRISRARKGISGVLGSWLLLLFCFALLPSASPKTSL
jgi:hypothetical protein